MAIVCLVEEDQEAQLVGLVRRGAYLKSGLGVCCKLLTVGGS